MSTAASVPSCVTAVNAAPGSLPKNTPETIRRCADDEIGRNSVRPWTRPRTTTSSQVTRRTSRSRTSSRAGGRQHSRRGTVPAGRRATPPRLPGVQRRQVGGSGLRVSRIGLGTMTWGDDTDVDSAADQLRAFLQAGGTLVETADGYGSGAAHDVLGGLLRRVVSRNDLVLAGRSLLDEGAHGSGAGRGALLAGLDRVLRRLGTEHLDLWQLPGWDADVPLDETLAVADAAVTSGRVRYVGLVAPGGWRGRRWDAGCSPAATSTARRTTRARARRTSRSGAPSGRRGSCRPCSRPRRASARRRWPSHWPGSAIGRGWARRWSGAGTPRSSRRR